MSPQLLNHSRSQLRVEALEDRSCPSVNVITFGSVLAVIGDNTANNVTVNDSGGGTVSATITGVGEPSATGTGTNIHTVIILTDGGNDTVDYTLAAPLTTSRAIGIDVGRFSDTANNSNRVNLDLSKGTTTTAQYLVANVIGGAGTDTVTESLGPVNGTFVALGTALGDGNDTFQGTLTGPVTGNSLVNVGVLGEGGNDSISVKGPAGGLSVSAPAHVNVALLGGTGNDTFTLNLATAPGSTGTATGFIDGGPGIDTETHTGTVIVINVP
jgi:hypothetical protein